MPTLTPFGRAAGTTFADRKIYFSEHVMAYLDEFEQKDTALHEIAHVIAGLTAGHGDIWRNVFLQLGGSGQVNWNPSPEWLAYRFRMLLGSPQTTEETR